MLKKPIVRIDDNKLTMTIDGKDVTFDDAEHTLGFNYTETEDYSKMDDEGNLPYSIEGTITFDGTEYAYKKSDKKNLKN